MVWIYLASAIFGGGFVLPALIGALDFDTDAEIDFDADTDVDFDASEVDLEGDTVVGGISDWVASLLNFRTLIFFATFFGAVGLVLTLFDYSEPLPFVSALALGGFAGVVNARLVSYVKRSEVSSHLADRELSGTTARVVLPISEEQRGKVEIDVGGQPTFLVALPYRSKAIDLAKGEQVVVIEVREGTAYVMPLSGIQGGT